MSTEAPVPSATVPTEFWNACAEFVETYGARPEKYTAATEQAQLKDRLVELSLQLAKAICASEYWDGGASVGYGAWAQLPWLAIYDRRETTTAQEGTYPVVHFSWEEPQGIRLGLGVAAAEFKRDAPKKAAEIRNALPEAAIGRFTESRFIDVTSNDADRVSVGSGKRANDYANSMVFERFIPLAELKSEQSELTQAFGTLLHTYKDWVDSKAATVGSERPSDFLEILQRYHDEKIVFLSPKQKAGYFIESVDDSGCSVRRVDGEAERVTVSGYESKRQQVKEHGSIDKRVKLDNTVARQMCYLQSAELGLSSNGQEVAYLPDHNAATDHFIERISAIASPKLYKPLILALVVEAISSGDLTENRITFDWIAPKFLDRCSQLGLHVGEQQVAEGFGRLTNDLFWMLAHHDPMKSMSSDKPTPAQIRSLVSHATIKEPYWRALQKEENRKRVLDAISEKWPDMNKPKQVVAPTESLSQLTEQLVRDIALRGFVYHPWQVAAYVTALRTKPFVILAGVSGTGKTKLPMLVSELTSATQPRRVAVRPDWTDSSDVMGYVDLQNEFRPGVVLQEMRTAATNSYSYHVCLIDEMNLARVEHYFAEFLSAVEDRSPADQGGYESSPILTQPLPNDDAEWGEQRIPSNLGVVGTVNMDESTHGFSRKVLDRAFTIELSDIDLTKGISTDDNRDTDSASAAWPIEFWQCPSARIDDLDLSDKQTLTDVNHAVETLQKANESLVHAQLQVGYRTRDEVALFVVNSRQIQSSFITSEGVDVDPMDLALMMKILPRIVGGSNSIRRVLLGLLGFATNGVALGADADPSDIIQRWERDGRSGAFPDARYPRTTARLCLMWDRLEVEGYTSFWL